jgi:hypothetical protein
MEFDEWWESRKKQILAAFPDNPDACARVAAKAAWMSGYYQAVAQLYREVEHLEELSRLRMENYNPRSA